MPDTDRTLLINGLARVDGARDTKTHSNRNLQLGNLELLFDRNETLIPASHSRRQGQVARVFSAPAARESRRVVTAAVPNFVPTSIPDLLPDVAIRLELNRAGIASCSK